MNDTFAPGAGFTTPDETSRAGKKVLHRAIAASAMGNATEWFDYGVTL